MTRLSLSQRLCLLPFLMILAAACGCQSHDTVGAAASAWFHAESPGPQAASTVSAPASETSAGGSRRVSLAGYRDGSADDDQTAGAQRRGTGNDSVASGGASLSMSFAAMQDAKTGDGDKATAKSETSGHSEESLAEINNKLNNPGADLAQLNFKMEWTQFEGRLGGNLAGGTAKGLKSLRAGNLFRGLRGLLGGNKGEGPSSQDSLSLLFQPVVPFSLSNGDHIIVRATIPIVWQPRYNAGTGGFDEDFGIGDSQLNVFYSKTDKKKGLMYGAGLAAGFPTHTDDWLGKDQFTLGPAAYVGTFGKWGSVGVFPQQLWNIGGAGGYTSQTAIQAWYWFSVGKGYQIGGSPLLIANWNSDDSDDIWSIPVNLGVAKTIMIGKLPVKIKAEAIYYVEQPDSFGPHWGFRLTITPVVPNPFERQASTEAKKS